MPINVCLECGLSFKVKGLKRAKKAIFCSRKCYGKNKAFVVTNGVKMNMLTIIEEVAPEIQYNSGKAGNIRKIKCQCDCGNIITTRLSSFLSGYAKSCGCIPKIGRTDGVGKCLSRHPLHRVWSNMIQRCTNPKNDNYHHYGGRGITVCEEWLGSYISFYEWALNNGWQKGLILDKDLKGGLIYNPENCVFITIKRSANFTRRNRLFYIDGVRFTLGQLCEKHRITRVMVERNLKKGQPIEMALIKKYKKNAEK